MTTKADGGPAFPIRGLLNDADFNGMTLRDYFAAHAIDWSCNDMTLGGVAEHLDIKTADYKWEIHWPMFVAKRAYAMADAMLAERNKS